MKMRWMMLLFVALLLASCNLTSDEVTQVSPDPDPDGEIGEPDLPGLSWYVITETETGLVVGCENYMTTIDTGIPRTGDVSQDVEATVNAMFGANQAFLEESVALTNFWGGGDFIAETQSFEGSRINLDITGDVVLTGACADAAMEAQMLLTIFDNNLVEEAYITINGENMKQIFDASGTITADEPYTVADVPAYDQLP
jgi:hypothetical protein